MQHSYLPVSALNQWFSGFLLQKGLNTRRKLAGVGGLTLPHDQNAPAHLLEGKAGGFVAELVPRELRLPVLEASLRHPGQAASFVLMPEAPMNEDRLPVPGKDEVRRAWQISAMEAEAKPHGVDELPDDNLGIGVDLADAAHVGAALLRV
jgi:hypothetical protein